MDPLTASLCSSALLVLALLVATVAVLVFFRKLRHRQEEGLDSPQGADPLSPPPTAQETKTPSTTPPTAQETKTPSTTPPTAQETKTPSTTPPAGQEAKAPSTSPSETGTDPTTTASTPSVVAPVPVPPASSSSPPLPPSQTAAPPLYPGTLPQSPQQPVYSAFPPAPACTDDWRAAYKTLGSNFQAAQIDTRKQLSDIQQSIQEIASVVEKQDASLSQLQTHVAQQDSDLGGVKSSVTALEQKTSAVQYNPDKGLTTFSGNVTFQRPISGDGKAFYLPYIRGGTMFYSDGTDKDTKNNRVTTKMISK